MKFAAMMATDFGRGLGLDAGVHENTALDKLAKKKNCKEQLLSCLRDARVTATALIALTVQGQHEPEGVQDLSSFGHAQTSLASPVLSCL